MSGRRVVITGASGLIGTALATHLRQRGEQVLALVRRAPRSPDEVRWDPQSGRVEASVLAGVDAVVHLAGAGIGDRRWTPAYKELLLRSRLEGTRTISAAVAEADHPVRLVTASAVGIYGQDRGEEVLTERSAPGDGFLAEVCRVWEGAAARAVEAGMPVAHARTGLVIAAEGGAFPRLARLTRFGLGGPLGSGRQYWPWITLADVVRGYTHLLDTPALTGPVNLVGPDPRPQRDVAAALAAALHRPSLVPAPAFALRIVLGELADDVLGGQRAVPAALGDSGFSFAHPTLTSAVATLT
ncbi:MAG: TIGR01777 family oxidoreductase [Dermatophilaceae bacterium]